MFASLSMEVWNNGYARRNTRDRGIFDFDLYLACQVSYPAI